MRMEPKWLERAKQLQSIAQAGLAYSKDDFDIERWKQIREISTEIVSAHTSWEQETIREIFASETGYATPKVDVRAVVFHEQKVLLVKEKKDGVWSLPGGWADIGLTASEEAVNEVKEESGFTVIPQKLLAVLDMQHHSHPPSLHHIYKLFFECTIAGGEAAVGMETNDVGFFAENELPPLSIARNTESQLQMVFRKHANPREDTAFD